MFACICWLEFATRPSGIGYPLMHLNRFAVPGPSYLHGSDFTIGIIQIEIVFHVELVFTINHSCTWKYHFQDMLCNLFCMFVAHFSNYSDFREDYMLPMMRVANSLVPTLVAPAVWRSKS